MPYGYFQLVRLLAFVGFVVLAYQANQQSKQNEIIIYIGLSLLFQPFIKIALGRPIWNAVDVIVGIGLIISVLIKPKDSLS